MLSARRSEIVLTIALAVLCADPLAGASFRLGAEERIFLTERLRSTCAPEQRQLCATLNISSASLETRCITSRQQCKGRLDVFLSDASSCEGCLGESICSGSGNDSENAPFCTSEKSLCEDYVSCGGSLSVSPSAKEESSSKTGDVQGIAAFVIAMIAIVLCCVLVVCIAAVIVRMVRRKDGPSPVAYAGEALTPTGVELTWQRISRHACDEDVAVPLGTQPAKHRALHLVLAGGDA